nr:hypothetical protein [Tanacetum cinerariifolium]
ALVEAYEADKAILDTYGDSPLDQTGGLNDKKKEESRHQLTLHLKKQPRVQADLQQGLNLDKCMPMSLLLQRNLCRLPVRWRKPYIRCLIQLNVDTLTPDLLAGPTYELMRGSCTSLTELEYNLEEVYKATTDQLDWFNPEDVYSKRRIIAVTEL